MRSKADTSTLNTTFAIVKKNIYNAIHTNDSVLDDCTLVNMRRLLYTSIVAIPVHIAVILFFLAKSTGESSAQDAWRKGIIGSHFVLLIVMILLLILTASFIKRERITRFMRAFQYVVVAVFLTMGVMLTTFDQLVTSNITPFLLDCILISAVVLIRPIYSIPIYAFASTLFYFLLQMTSSNADVLLSNRMNGLAAAGIGSVLSIIIWQYNSLTIEQRRFIDNQKAMLEQMAFLDPLTGLSNRRFFDEVIRKEIASMRRYGHESCILILDIDKFKRINDKYGHPVGDGVLIQLAALLKKEIRETDILSRLGGEEFIFLLPRTSLESGRVLAEKLRKRIEEQAFCTASQVVRITASFGISPLRFNEEQPFFTYYSQADEALYRAKTNGRNRVELATSSDNEGTSKASTR